VPKQTAVRAVESWPPAEPDLLAELYQAHGPRLLALCQRRLGDARLAEDALHEALLKAHRAQRSYRSEQPMWPWLSTIARNVCIDMQRRQSRVTPVEPQQLDRPVADADPDDLADRAARRQLLVDALTSLPVQYRRPVYLKHIKGWSYEQIAAYDRTTLAAVRTRLMRGRRELRARVEDLARRRGQWPLPALAPLGWLRLRAARARAAVMPAEGALAPALANLAPFAFAFVLTAVPTTGLGGSPAAPPRPTAAAVSVAYHAVAKPRVAPREDRVPVVTQEVAVSAVSRVIGLAPDASAAVPVPAADEAADVELGPVELRCGQDGGPITATVCGLPAP
jgi:RNA polymerase sigma-70 factor (ECF subfamily)